MARTVGLGWANLNGEHLMHLFNVHEATTRFAKLLEKASKGQEGVIAKACKPMAS